MERQPDVWTQVNQVKDQPASIELHRGAKGGYDWTIKLYSSDLTACITEIDLINSGMELTYGGGQRDEKQTT